MLHVNTCCRQASTITDGHSRARVSPLNGDGLPPSPLRHCKQVTLWQPRVGKISRGRQVRRWEDDLKQTAGPFWLRVARDRIHWKELEEAYAKRHTNLGTSCNPMFRNKRLLLLLVTRKIIINDVDFVKETYAEYFGFKMDKLVKSWVSHKVCKSLRLWKKGQRAGLDFGVPMIWMEPKNHFDDCYFCVVDAKGFNRNQTWRYPDLESTKCPVAQ
ncbi:hypothetical protein EVAR_92783_1 [Eumeta japonica]|uniref:Uncharacterized protein n=1 Tax=Eumeta variegata TaxID=151549 RepID=A0A4C1T0V8_EUMVA|nr:hypothetical protein EVAR_92783_1 [Eumeta japonica]